GAVAPANLLELARAATEVTMTRTKLLCLTLALTGLTMVGVTLLPLVGAQEVPVQVPPQGGGGSAGGGKTGGGPAMMPGGGRATNANPAWEYKYVVRRS